MPRIVLRNYDNSTREQVDVPRNWPVTPRVIIKDGDYFIRISPDNVMKPEFKIISHAEVVNLDPE